MLRNTKLLITISGILLFSLNVRWLDNVGTPVWQLTWRRRAVPDGPRCRLQGWWARAGCPGGWLGCKSSQWSYGHHLDEHQAVRKWWPVTSCQSWYLVTSKHTYITIFLAVITYLFIYLFQLKDLYTDQLRSDRWCSWRVCWTRSLWPLRLR